MAIDEFPPSAEIQTTDLLLKVALRFPFGPSFCTEPLAAKILLQQFQECRLEIYRNWLMPSTGDGEIIITNY